MIGQILFIFLQFFFVRGVIWYVSNQYLKVKYLKVMIYYYLRSEKLMIYLINWYL